jgi:hypothetical protein
MGASKKPRESRSARLARKFVRPDAKSGLARYAFLIVAVVSIAFGAFDVLFIHAHWPVSCEARSVWLFCSKPNADSPATTQSRMDAFDTWLRSQDVGASAAAGRSAPLDDAAAANLKTGLVEVGSEMRWLGSFFFMQLTFGVAIGIALMFAWLIQDYVRSDAGALMLLAQCLICGVTPILYYGIVAHFWAGYLPAGMAYYPVPGRVLVDVEEKLPALMNFSDGLALSVVLSWLFFIALLFWRRAPESNVVGFYLALQNAVTTFGVALSAVLIAIVMHARAYFYWPLGDPNRCTPPEGQKPDAVVAALCSTNDSLLFIYGVGATFFLGLMITLSATIVRIRLQREAESRDDEDPNKWLSDRGLNISAANLSIRIFSVGAPLFSGVLSGAFDKLSS